MGRKDNGGYQDPEASDGGGPFAALLKAKGLIADDAGGRGAAVGEPEAGDRAEAVAEPGLPLWTKRKVVVRRERKGRRGKTVVIVSGLGESEPSLGEIARKLKKALGTGASVEGSDIVVMGDIPDRVAAWLERAGAKRVVRGS